MSEKEKDEKPKGVSRREFLKDAGLVVGGATVGSMAILSACKGETTTQTVTNTKTVTGTSSTSTTTVTAPAITTTVTGPTTTVSKFVCPVDSQEFSSLDALKSHFTTAHPLAPVSSLNVIKVKINGHEYEVQVEPQETLHDVLREKFGLLSLKDMCTGWGACGSCSLIVDGRPILSCMGLAIEFNGAVMETAEGLQEKKHPLIDSYVKNYAMQCGYCTPGFVVTAKALLDHNPNPTVEEIRDALGGNLCRCGTYPQHIPAVQEAATILRGGK